MYHPMPAKEGILIERRIIKYKLILETNNPSTDFRDMMAVLFLYLYDKEMEEHLKVNGLVGI